MSSLSGQCSNRNAAIEKFPVEVWIAVFRNISHPSTLAHVIQVNRHLCAIVEERLYDTVSLTGDIHFSKFRLSIISSPHRAPFVKDLRLLDLEGRNSPVPNILPSFLTSLRNLQRLELTQAFDLKFTSDTPYCDVLSVVQIPRLRSLTIKADLHPHRFLTFLDAHADCLDELLITNTFWFKDLPVVDLLSARKFPALRVLECDDLFIGGHERDPVPPNLAHLSRPLFHSWELALLAGRLGTQLVSLKLGLTLLDDRGRVPSESWSLLDVKAKFPRLRYLQVETHCSLTSFIPTPVINWFADKALGTGTDTKIRTRSSSTAPQSHSRITIAWVFAIHIQHDDQAWDRFATERAVHVLKAFGGYVERVFQRHHSRWVSVRLGAGAEVQGERQVIREEMGDMDGYWAQV